MHVMAKRRVMFCLTHTLLKSMAILSACEADFGVLLSIALLTYMDFGHHMALVYGNYTEDLRRLGRMMGLQIVQA